MGIIGYSYFHCIMLIMARSDIDEQLAYKDSHVRGCGEIKYCI